VVAYITKDKVYVQDNIDVTAFLKARKEKKSTKSNAIAAMMMAGKTREEINELEPGFVMMHSRRLDEYEAWLQTLKEEPKAKWERLPDDYDLHHDEQIAGWLNGNLFQPRKLKQPQLYLFGDANMGKTTLITNLSRFCRIYYIPPDEDFYCDFDNDRYDLAIIDEFKGQKTIQWLNRWLDGQPFPLRRKGKPAYLKTKNIPTIIISNYPLETIYRKRVESNSAALDPLNSRLDVIKATSPINVLYSDE